MKFSVVWKVDGRQSFDGRPGLNYFPKLANQAWVKDGKYIRCGHPEAMACGCYGREHAGSPVNLSIETMDI
jgi:hypothetical protein